MAVTSYINSESRATRKLALETLSAFTERVQRVKIVESAPGLGGVWYWVGLPVWAQVQNTNISQE
jgi:hypothetical protein